MRALVDDYARVRAATDALVTRLSDEDQQIQSHPDTRPVKWHRGHTTWFFEAHVLQRAGYEPLHDAWATLFASHDGSLSWSRPSAKEIAAWRRVVDARVRDVLCVSDDSALMKLVRLGVAHEERHQERILTDILHAFAHNPVLREMRVVPGVLEGESYAPVDEHAWHDPHPALRRIVRRGPLTWRAFEGGPADIGVDENDDFSFDDERPRHTVWLEPYMLASRVVTVGEAREFIRAGGYRTRSLWLSDGFERVQREGWCAPLYARVEDGAYVTFTLTGEREAHDDEPARHLSYYEADAIARFMGGRLPTEVEWEHAAGTLDVDGHYGDVWEWTSSAYLPYPGFKAERVSNGKRMSNRMVLRGGSIFSPRGHVRPSSRNFWPPHTRHQMSGVRLARDA